MLKITKNMFHCLPNVIETSKKRQKISPNLGHTRGGGEAEMESGHTFLLFFVTLS